MSVRDRFANPTRGSRLPKLRFGLALTPRVSERGGESSLPSQVAGAVAVPGAAAAALAEDSSAPLESMEFEGGWASEDTCDTYHIIYVPSQAGEWLLHTWCEYEEAAAAAESEADDEVENEAAVDGSASEQQHMVFVRRPLPGSPRQMTIGAAKAFAAASSLSGRGTKVLEDLQRKTYTAGDILELKLRFRDAYGNERLTFALFLRLISSVLRVPDWFDTCGTGNVCELPTRAPQHAFSSDGREGLACWLRSSSEEVYLTGMLHL